MDLDIYLAQERLVQAELDRRLEASMAQIERGEGIPGDRILDALAERRAARNPRS